MTESEGCDHQTRRYLLRRSKTCCRVWTGRCAAGPYHPEWCGKPAQSDSDLRSDHIKDEQGEAAYPCRIKQGKLWHDTGFRDPFRAGQDHWQAETKGEDMSYWRGTVTKGKWGIKDKPGTAYIGCKRYSPAFPGCSCVKITTCTLGVFPAKSSTKRFREYINR